MTKENTHQNFSVEVGFDETQEAPVTKEQVEAHDLDYGKDPDPATDDGLILGKFKDRDALETAYKELESKLGAPDDKNTTDTEDPDNPEGTEDPDADPGDPGDSEGDDGLPSDQDTTEEEDDSGDGDGPDGPDSDDTEADTVKESVDSAFRALEEAGEMTEEVQEAFDAVGISQELVDHYRELVEFKATAELNEQMAIAGGEEAYKAMTTWAGDNLTEAEVASFDKIIDEGSSDDIKLAITNMKARMDNKKAPKKDSLVKASTTSKTKSVYNSQEEVNKDMADARWDTDEAYRNKVYAKLSRSQFNK